MVDIVTVDRDGLPVLVAGDSYPAFVYRAFDEHGVLLYVGVSSRVAARLVEHAQAKWWWPEVAQVTIEPFTSRKAATEAETIAIRTERPLMNISNADGPATLDGGQNDLGAMGRRCAAAREAFRAAMKEVRLEVVRGIGTGEYSESGAARISGIDRMTVRQWLGKRTR